LAMLIGQILSAKGSAVVTTHADATVADVVKLLKEKHIGAVVVADRSGGLCGIVSERDVTRGLAEHGTQLLDMKVGNIMTQEVVTCSPDDGIEKLMTEMTEGRFRHLPVVSGKELIGIISIGDVVKHRLHELEEETHQLHDYIAGSA
ncbi:MAG: CBS domain-containing protein, partial [Geminicoccaceae bacterium]|nr:CBS domain-containing protein [Geminicoccaceae bacterium]